VGLIPSMECCGVLSASIDTIRKILQTVAGPDPMDFSMPAEQAPDLAPQTIDPFRITVGVVAEAQSDLSEEQAAAFRAAVQDLERAGFAVRELSLPDFALFSAVHQIVGSVEASSSAGRYDSVRYGRRAPGARNWNDMYLRSRGAAFGILLKSYLFQGAFFQFERYAAFEDACRLRARLVAGMERLASLVDFLALPAVCNAPSGDPDSLADTYAQFHTTLFANVTGQPSLVLPPVPGAAPALQLTALRLGDGRLLAIGEHLLDWRRKGNA
jgi:aspartyl-tRNA(Asn)/glutamyl-tRNA(Gln) amidotransferase subunit A